MAGLFDPSMFNGLPISGLLAQLAGIQGPGGQGPTWGGNVGMSPQGQRAYALAGGAPGPSALDPANIPLPMADPRTAMASGAPAAPPGIPAGGMVPPQPDPSIGAQPSPAGPAGGAQPGFLDKLGSGLSGAYLAAPMLMQAGGAMMTGGIGKGLEAMGSGTQALQQRQYQLMMLQQTMALLQKKGLSPGDAYLVATNPEMMKAYSGNFGPDNATMTTIKNPNDPTTETSALLRPRAGSVQMINPGASAGLPPELAGAPDSAKLAAAPEGSVVNAGGARYIKRNGTWSPL